MMEIIGKLNPVDKKIHIWGAGFSGLIIGHYLKQKGFQVFIYETSNKIGGKLGTRHSNIGLVEQGANALFMNADVMDFLHEINLDPVPAAKKLKRLLLINGRIKKPLNPIVIFKIIANLPKKPPLITEGLTVLEFFLPLIGKKNVEQYLNPILGGIYATSAEKLHFKSVFPELNHFSQFSSYWSLLKFYAKRFKNRPKLEIKGSISFTGGMQTLIDRLGKELKDNIKLNYKGPFVVKNNTILCTDAKSASELLAQTKPELSAELERISYQPLTSTTVFLKREIKSLQKSFGVLIAQDLSLNSIGVLNNKAIFPANHENVISYTFISNKKCSKDELINDIKYFQDDITHDDVVHMESFYWPSALPIYNLQRYLSVKKLHQLLENSQGLMIFGNYVAGISLREMLSVARNFVKKL